MDETGWLTDDDYFQKIQFVLGQNSKRKLRLFACAATRHFWSFIPSAGRVAVVETERWIESQVSRKEWMEAHLSAERAFRSHTGFRAFSEALRLAVWCSHPQLHSAVSQTCSPSRPLGNGQDFNHQWPIVRDIFGNPFRPIVFADAWRSETVVALASAIYAERAFDRMPILADALEETGCDHTDILSHCRGPGPHVRGCWVVDLVLGKV